MCVRTLVLADAAPTTARACRATAGITIAGRRTFELELHVVPVLLGQGRRLFDNLPAEHVELDLLRRLTTPDVDSPVHRVTHLRYRVLR